MMGYVGDAEKDLCIQRAFCIMRNRKYDIQLKDWYGEKYRRVVD